MSFLKLKQRHNFTDLTQVSVSKISISFIQVNTFRFQNEPVYARWSVIGDTLDSVW